MHNLIDIRICRKSICQQALCCVFSICVIFAMLTTLSQAADDPYLEMLNQEATKVESESSDTGGDGSALSSTNEGPQSASTLPSREHFESLLRRQNVGTYSFYRKLPERSREEIFLDYSKGASMEALRNKIVDRYLQP